MHAAGAVVADGRGDAVGRGIAPGPDGDDGQVAMQPLPDGPLLLADPLAVETVDHHVASLPVRMRHDGLGVAVGVDRQFQQPHLRRRDGVGVVVVGLDLFAGHPQHAIDRLGGKGAVLMQALADLVDGFDPLAQRQAPQFVEQEPGPARQVRCVWHACSFSRWPSCHG